MEMESSLHLQQQIARLQALLDTSHKIHSTIELDHVLRSVLQITVRELEMAGAFFTAFPFSYGDIPPRFLLHPPSSDPKRGCSRFPLLDRKGEVLTEMVVITRDGSPLSLFEQDFLEHLATQAAVAIENARYHERTLDMERVKQDLACARDIQRSLLPQSFPNIAGYSIDGRSQTCYEVGGDYLDIIELTSGQLMIVVADVAGKGLASALVGSSFRSALRAIANSGMSLVEIATHMNVLHYNEGEESRRRYVTSIFLRLDPATHTLEVVNAGHNPGFLLNGSDLPEMIEASGTPVGMLPFSTYRAEKYVLSNKAKLLIYTDGMTEVFQGNEEFGQDRLLEAFRASRAVDAPSTLKSIWQALDAFSNQESQTDDMTALVIGRKP
ncbi:PP2C family protein-serine/threonine phosphatase [Tunturiibacter lichenicola]|uniref:PP2C family protein-serine/threonine phosphatase n=1 Tax=Tunturiibacter lichenicola TaxID=2051959 RepID=UPI0021B1FF01|nr:PP2C family protein-serine/threonine phosphatase [Edaphobacter lichenicola]